MAKSFQTQSIPSSRIATFDVLALGLKKHHVSALLEVDVTLARKKLRVLRRNGQKVSLNGWLIKCICESIMKYPEAAAYKSSKRKLVIFNDLNVSFMVEKENNAHKVPLPLLLEKANRRSVAELSEEIEASRVESVRSNTIVLNSRSRWYERFYYSLPKFTRHIIWKAMLSMPQFAFKKMGNVVVTSLGMIGKVNGWFIHRSVHPVSFGIGAVINKPVAIGKEIQIREILNMTVLIDHDVIDGAPMVRLIKELTRTIEEGRFLDELV